MSEPTIDEAIEFVNSIPGKFWSPIPEITRRKCDLAIRALEEMRESRNPDASIWDRRFGDILQDYPYPGDGCTGRCTYKGVDYFYRIGNGEPFDPYKLNPKPRTWDKVTLGEVDELAKAQGERVDDDPTVWTNWRNRLRFLGEKAVNNKPLDRLTTWRSLT